MKVTKQQIIDAVNKTEALSYEEPTSLYTEFKDRVCFADEYRCGHIIIELLENLGITVEDK